MNRRFLFLSLLTALMCGPPQTGIAAPSSKSAPKLLGTFGEWKANSYEGDQAVCYMTLSVRFAPNKKVKRGMAWLTITHRPGENSKDVVSYASGYNFKLLSDVTATIGKKSFDLFTAKDTAWSRDSATDHALAAAIREGSSIKIAGTPDAKGAIMVTDTFSLKGAAAAYQAIGKACGYAVETPSKPPPSHKKPMKTGH